MGQALAGQGKYQDAITVYTAGRKIFMDTVGPDHPHVASCCYNIGLVHRQLNEKSKANEYFIQALNIWSPIFGPDHPQTKAVQQYLQESS